MTNKGFVVPAGAWGLPPVLSALGILFSIVFVFLLLPLVLRETALSPAEARSARP
jgi:hypothetical protein